MQQSTGTTVPGGAPFFTALVKLMVVSASSSLRWTSYSFIQCGHLQRNDLCVQAGPEVGHGLAAFGVMRPLELLADVVPF